MRTPALRFGVIAAVAVLFAFVAVHPALAANQTLSTGNWLLSIFSAVAMYVAEAIGKFVIAILDITIPLMRYQGFTSSPVVSAGWAVVRDVVNMFFVVVLIIIAMGTIFGSSRFQWKQAVPRLMIFAIVINFSKTLCGIMIDFAQVVMLTFANALKDIAGGNFIQLLGLGDIFSFSDKADAIAQSAAGTGSGTGPFDYFVASVAAVLMMVWVLAVVIMLLFILVYRVVMLWILIVLAPLAWFMGGQTVLKSGSEAYSEWWKNFICYTAIGPVITFFLWLTLAVAGSGFIAANDPGLSSLASGGNLSSNVSNVVTKVFEFQRLLSFVIGMAMMMVGFDAAAKICNGVKGPGFQALLSAGKGVPGKIGGYVGGQARKYGGKGLAAGFAGAQSAVSGTGAAGLALAGGGGLAALRPSTEGQAARAKGLRNLSKKGWMPDVISKELAQSADTRQKELAEKLEKSSKDTFKNMSSDSKVEYLNRVSKNGIPFVDQFGRDASMGLLAEALSDPKMREKLEASGTLADLYSKHGATLKEYLKGTPGAKAIDEFEAGRPDITRNFGGINSEDDLRKLDPAALARLKGNAAFEAQLRTFKTSVRDAAGMNLDGLAFLNEGYGSGKQVRAWRDGMTGVYEGMGKPSLDMVPAEDIAANASDALIRRRPDAAKNVAAHRSKSVRQRMFDPALNREVNSRIFGATVDPRTGAILSIDRKATNAELRKNIFAIKNLDNIEMNGDLAEEVTKVYTEKKNLEELAMQYRMASPDDRREMDASLIANVITSFDESIGAARASGNTGEATRIDGAKRSLLLELESVEGGNADMRRVLSSDIAALRTNEARLVGISRPTPAQVNELRRVRNDLGLMRLRLAMH